jgi:two-component system, OmpR family, response regulator ResD
MGARETLILVADDEDRMRRLVGDYLRREGYAVLEAADGREAISAFASKPGIDLAILDVMMPNLDGWVALREIKARTRVPIIMLTAKSEEEDELLGFSLGADEYIRKPVSPRVLVARVNAVLKRARGGGGEPADELAQNLEGTGIGIDREGCRVSSGGAEVRLSPREYDILLLLAARAGAVLNRDRILDAVWGIGYSGDPRTVDTHVKNLRAKLGEAGAAIETVRGFGYRFSKGGQG